MKNRMVIGIMELERELDSTLPLEERLKAMMRAARKHWCVTDEEEQFKMAIAVVLLHASEGEKARIESELKTYRAISAAANGIPVDFDSLFRERDLVKHIGLRKLWNEVKLEQ